ncbi:hypothetical protein HanPSC8_Chr04g0180681 [Helianthus annuus]|nr:hypothetical protein HanPSC8_Chr04g0180681 [Helianthus annuus]
MHRTESHCTNWVDNIIYYSFFIFVLSIFSILIFFEQSLVQNIDISHPIFGTESCLLLNRDPAFLQFRSTVHEDYP